MSDAAMTFTRELLSYGQRIRDVLDAADAAPRDPVLNAYAAAASLFAMTAEAPAKAAPYLARAAAAARDPDDVELVRAVSAWSRGDLDAAIAIHRERLRRRPDDLAAAKICQLHHLDRGDAGGLVDTVRLVLPANERDPRVLGQLAFALEQVGDLDGSEAAARRALALEDGDDPWTHHAMAHALYSRGRVAEGIDWIEGQAALWERSNAFMFTHAWWHAAICHLDDDRPDRALAIYDEQLTQACPDCVQSLVNAVSLLARLSLRGVDLGDRWDAVAERLVARSGDRVNGFLDLHYLYGLALAGRGAEAATMLAALAATAAGEGARGLEAHAAGRVAEAAERLGRAAPRLRELGGSHEQRDLYELVELDAALRAGRREHARALLARRVASRPTIVWQRRALAAIERAAA